VEKIVEFIKGHFSGYTVALIFICSYMLIFVDRRQMMKKRLKKEAAFSFISGITYIVIAVAAIVISRL